MKSLVSLLLALASLQASAAPEEIYRRAELIESRTGVVKLRTVYSPRLNVPVGCEDGSLDCVEGFRFARLYSLDLWQETRRAVDGGTRLDLEKRGSVYLALQMDGDDEVLFDEELRNYLSSLSADAFANEYAEITGTGSPLTSIPRRSVETSWSCFRSGDSGRVTRYDRQTRELEDGTVEVIGGGLSDFPFTDTNPHAESLEEFCDEMAAAADSAFPDELRTMAVPRLLLERSIEQVTSNTLPTEAYGEELTPIPGEGSFTRKREPGMVTSSSSSRTEGSIVLSRGKNEVQWIARTAPAEIKSDAVSRGAWLSRWTVSVEERTLGPYPQSEVLSESTLLMALLPTTPSIEVDEEDRPLAEQVAGRLYEIRFDESAFLTDVAEQLDHESKLNLKTLERMLVDAAAGVESEGWIQVICHPDGSAEFGLVPTGVGTPLLNADPFCASVDVRVE